MLGPVLCISHRRYSHRSNYTGFPLVVQWLRICLTMQGTQLDLWSGKIPFAMEQVSPCAINYCTHMLWSPCSATGETNEKPMHHNQRVAPAQHNQRKPTHSNEDPEQPKINEINQKREITTVFKEAGKRALFQDSFLPLKAHILLLIPLTHLSYILEVTL